MEAEAKSTTSALAKPEAGAEEVIVVRDLHKAFGEKKVLQGFDLTVHRGENVMVPVSYTHLDVYKRQPCSDRDP